MQQNCRWAAHPLENWSRQTSDFFLAVVKSQMFVLTVLAVTTIDFWSGARVEREIELVTEDISENGYNVSSRLDQFPCRRDETQHRFGIEC